MFGVLPFEIVLSIVKGDPNEYEDKSEQFERYEDSVNTDKNVTDESEFRAWDGVEDDWQEFNKKKDEK